MRKRLTFNSREEWLEQRGKGIGASEVATIIGLNPWETPRQLWQKKLGMVETEETTAMRRGHFCEDAVATWWAAETGREVIGNTKGDFIIIDSENPILQVSPDRLWWLPGQVKNDDNKGVLECKTTNMTVDTENIPMHWYCQVQMNLGVSGYRHGALAWIGRDFTFGCVDIAFDKDFFSYISCEAVRFYEENVLGLKEPTPVNAADVLAKFPRHAEGKSVACPDDLHRDILELAGLKEKIETLEERRTAIEDACKIAMGEADSLVYAGETLVTWKASKASTKFDAKRFQAEHPDEAAAYMVETPGTRRFLLKI